MIDNGGREHGGIVEENDWEHLFDGIPIPEGTTFAVDDDWPDSEAFLLIEQFLMNDNDEQPAAVQDLDHNLTDSFFSDVFLNSPVEDSSSDKTSESEKVDDVALPQEEDKVNDDVVVEQDDKDPLSKKRKRQLRNRDAAVRSRERKKMHVRDLEMKSKYFEAECRRLGMLLQCCLAENHALRLSLHNSKAVGASMTKQESAVLLLESLLLGSLLWFLGIICLLILPKQLQSTQKTVPLDNEDRGSLGQRKGRSRIFRNLIFQSFMMGKRCKASRWRIKLISFALEVKALSHGKYFPFIRHRYFRIVPR